MALPSGRVGVDQDQVDEFGTITTDNVSFKDLVEYKIKLDISLLTASNFNDFKNVMTDNE